MDGQRTNLTIKQCKNWSVFTSVIVTRKWSK